MAILKNIKQFDNNCEWAYLYAIADVYQTYAGPYYGYTKDDFPHPLKDYEIINILKSKYGITLHQNTIANYRKKLETYFGFHFRTNKKGRFINQTVNEVDMTLASLLPLFTQPINTITVKKLWRIKEELENTVINNAETKNEKETDEEKLYKIFQSMRLNHSISFFDYFKRKEIIGVVKTIFVDQTKKIRVSCTFGEGESYSFFLNSMNNIKIIKIGRPSIKR